MLGLRRIALRAFQAPLPSFATPSPIRSIGSVSISRVIRPIPIASFRISRRWISEEARPAPEVKDEEAAPLESEPYTNRTDKERVPISRPSSFAKRQPLPRQDVPPTNVVYVGNLFYDITDADLRREFEKIAPVKSSRIIFDRRGLSKGHGYVEYDNVEDAMRAVETMNEQVFEGRRMVVNYQIAVPTPRRPAHARSEEPSRTIFIGNMSYQMTDQDLNDLFRDIRNVIDVRVAIDRRTGTPKGFAHADFIDVQSAENAMRVLEQKRIYGRQLRVDYSVSSQVRSPVAEDNPEESTS